MEKYIEYTIRNTTKRYLELTKIDNPQDAYFIGYMYGDGGFVVHGGQSFMMVNSINQKLIEFFRDRYAPDAVIYNFGRKSSAKVRAINECYELRFTGRFSKQLDKFGLFCKKNDRKVLGIPNAFFINVLHGLFDSDGFWTVGNRKDCRVPRLRGFITHRSQYFLHDVQRKLSELYNISSTVAQHENKECYRLGIQNTLHSIELVKKMYNYNIVCNDVKKSKVLQYLNSYVRQKSDELLEPVNGISSQATSTLVEGSETT